MPPLWNSVEHKACFQHTLGQADVFNLHRPLYCNRNTPVHYTTLTVGVQVEHPYTTHNLTAQPPQFAPGLRARVKLASAVPVTPLPPPLAACQGWSRMIASF